MIPWCSVDAAHPDRHDWKEIELAGFVDAEWCPACTGGAQ